MNWQNGNKHLKYKQQNYSDFSYDIYLMLEYSGIKWKMKWLKWKEKIKR